MLDSVQTTVKIFGERMGCPGLELNAQGVLHLSIEGFGELFIDHKEDIFISLFRPYDFLSRERLLAALAMCHPLTPRAFPPHAVLSGEHLLGFSVKIPHERFDVGTLELVIQFLQTLQEDLQAHGE
ncbi:MAG: CesT family type III secretion system chaperone [Puniceicoccales bacterium]|jgi:type III secretion system chaperone SycN|nr:CesT family type III secretion system chaperone [Puniceicoccales bacterium]